MASWGCFSVENRAVVQVGERATVGQLLGGAVIIEQVFSLPGVGRYALEGINLRDYPVVQGAVLLIAAAFVVVNLLVDVIYGLIDPRVRYG